MIGRAVVAHDTVDGDVAADGGATIVPSTLLASLPSFFLFFSFSFPLFFFPPFAQAKFLPRQETFQNRFLLAAQRFFFFFKKEETSWRVGKVWIGRRESLENRVDHRFNFSSNSFLSVYGKSVSLNPLLNGPGFGSGVTHVRGRICNGNLYFLLQIKERILRKFWGEWK